MATTSSRWTCPPRSLRTVLVAAGFVLTAPIVAFVLAIPLALSGLLLAPIAGTSLFALLRDRLKAPVRPARRRATRGLRDRSGMQGWGGGTPQAA